MWRRVVIAAVVLVATVLIVYSDRSGYIDNNGDGEISVLDAPTTPRSPSPPPDTATSPRVPPAARLTNIVVITPLRFVFLIVLVGTTLEVLTARRAAVPRQPLEERVKKHTVVIGYGMKGRSAIRGAAEHRHSPTTSWSSTRTRGRSRRRPGRAYRRARRRRRDGGAPPHAVEKARAVIVAANRDDAAVLIVLTVRQLNPSVPITASVREEENANLLRQSGADSVITTSATSGRLLGLSPDQPGVVHVVEDLLTAGRGLDLQQRTVTLSEVGLGARQLRDVVLSVRAGRPRAAVRRPADRHAAER